MAFDPVTAGVGAAVDVGNAIAGWIAQGRAHKRQKKFDALAQNMDDEARRELAALEPAELDKLFYALEYGKDIKGLNLGPALQLTLANDDQLNNIRTTLVQQGRGLNDYEKRSLDFLEQVRDRGLDQVGQQQLQQYYNQTENQARRLRDANNQALINQGHDPSKVNFTSRLLQQNTDPRNAAINLNAQLQQSKLGAIDPMQKIFQNSFTRTSTTTQNLGDLNRFNTNILNDAALRNWQRRNQIDDQNIGTQNTLAEYNAKNKVNAYREALDSRNQNRRYKINWYGNKADSLRGRAQNQGQRADAYGQQAGRNLGDAITGFGQLGQHYYNKQKQNKPPINYYSQGNYNYGY